MLIDVHAHWGPWFFSMDTASIEVNLDAGTANVRTGNGKVIEIFESAAGGERKYVQTSYDPTLTVALNAGSYVTVVEYADGRKVEKAFSIAAGKRADVEVSGR